MFQRLVFPVVHHMDQQTTLEQGRFALSSGADGIFLISHNGGNSELFDPARILKNQFPHAKIGINLLGESPVVGLQLSEDSHLDMIWTDHPGVDSTQVSPIAYQISQYLHQSLHKPLFFWLCGI